MGQQELSGSEFSGMVKWLASLDMNRAKLYGFNAQSRNELCPKIVLDRQNQELFENISL